MFGLPALIDQRTCNITPQSAEGPAGERLEVEIRLGAAPAKPGAFRIRASTWAPSGCQRVMVACLGRAWRTHLAASGCRTVLGCAFGVRSPLWFRVQIRSRIRVGALCRSLKGKAAVATLNLLVTAMRLFIAPEFGTLFRQTGGGSEKERTQPQGAGAGPRWHYLGRNQKK